jgi:hypothetical protein
MCMIECGFLTSRAHDGVQTVFQGVFVADAAHLLAHFTSHFNILETILLQLSQVLTDSTAWPSQSYTLTYYGSFTIYRV